MLEAARALDEVGNKAARGKIAAAKALAPTAALRIIDRAIQVVASLGYPLVQARPKLLPALSINQAILSLPALYWVVDRSLRSLVWVTANRACALLGSGVC